MDEVNSPLVDDWRKVVGQQWDVFGHFKQPRFDALACSDVCEVYDEVVHRLDYLRRYSVRARQLRTRRVVPDPPALAATRSQSD